MLEALQNLSAWQALGIYLTGAVVSGFLLNLYGEEKDVDDSMSLAFFWPFVLLLVVLLSPLLLITGAATAGQWAQKRTDSTLNQKDNSDE